MPINMGDLYDQVDQQLNADALVLVEEGQAGLIRTVSAEELKAWSNNLARQMLALGAAPGDKAAVYSRNRVEYLVAAIAAMKARLVHVNVNYRYKEAELLHVLDNSDARIVLFESEFAPRLAAVRTQLKELRHCIEIADGEAAEWALPYQELIASGDGAPLDIARSADDLFFMYTGGTTGLPKGVMWQQGDMWRLIGRNLANPFAPPPTELAQLETPAQGGGLNNLAILPFMHGAGIWSAMNTLAYGNQTVILRTESFDADLALRNVGKHQIVTLVIAGDAFARPLLDALAANPGAYQLSSLKFVASTAMVFSSHYKRALLEHCPHLVITDNVGSSESSASAMAMINKDSQLDDGEVRMQLTPNAKVFTEDLQEVKPGSGQRGFLAVTGVLPLGYYKDAQKTAETFVTVDSVRYSRPGDWVEVLADGAVKFLGRGNISINTGGEKVYPEEVETALKSHAEVRDCLVVGVPDERWGQAIAALVQLRQGAGRNAAQLQDHVRARLSGYKVPRHLFFIEEMFRSPSGKADYPAAKAFAEAQVAATGGDA